MSAASERALGRGAQPERITVSPSPASSSARAQARGADAVQAAASPARVAEHGDDAPALSHAGPSAGARRTASR